MKISKANIQDLDEILNLIAKVNKKLLSEGFSNWNKGYPNEEIISGDITNLHQYKLTSNSEIIGIYSLASYDYEVFNDLNFADNSDNYAMIHRLAVTPSHQSKGLAKLLMDNAENTIKEASKTSIRLGVLSTYKQIVDFYLNRDYKIKGETYFGVDKSAFYLMEKII